MWLQIHVNLFALDRRNGFRRSHMGSLGPWREVVACGPGHFSWRAWVMVWGLLRFFFFESKMCRIKGNGKEAFFCWMACNVGAARAVGATVSVFFHKPLDTAVDSFAFEGWLHGDKNIERVWTYLMPTCNSRNSEFWADFDSRAWDFWKLDYSSGQAAKSFASPGKDTHIYEMPTLS